jgi:hypothetical protein
MLTAGFYGAGLLLTFYHLAGLILSPPLADDREHLLHLINVFWRTITLLKCFPALEECHTLGNMSLFAHPRKAVGTYFGFQTLALEILVGSVEHLPCNLYVTLHHRYLVRVLIKLLTLSPRNR